MLKYIPIKLTRPGARPQNNGSLPYVFTKMHFIFSYLYATANENYK